jgi:2-haloacid dehalogenase
MTAKVVIFDVNETLSDLERLGDRFEEIGAPRSLLATWFAATLRDGIALAAAGGYADFRDVGRGALLPLLGELAVGDAADHVLDGIAELPLHADVAPGIRRLRDGGLRVATLTNGSAATTAALLGSAGLDELVERNLSVSEVGRWKPAAEPYLFACRELGVSPGEAVMVAVHPWDVDGAKRAGLRGAWLDRTGSPYPDTLMAPDASAADLTELADALAG